MEQCKISNMYTLEETIAKDYLAQFTYPWEALAGIGGSALYQGIHQSTRERSAGGSLRKKRRGYLGGKIRCRGTDSMFKWSFNY